MRCKGQPAFVLRHCCLYVIAVITSLLLLHHHITANIASLPLLRHRCHDTIASLPLFTSSPSLHHCHYCVIVAFTSSPPLHHCRNDRPQWKDGRKPINRKARCQWVISPCILFRKFIFQDERGDPDLHNEWRDGYQRAVNTAGANFFKKATRESTWPTAGLWVREKARCLCTPCLHHVTCTDCHAQLPVPVRGQYVLYTWFARTGKDTHFRVSFLEHLVSI